VSIVQQDPGEPDATPCRSPELPEGTISSDDPALNQRVSRVLSALHRALRRKYPRASTDLIATGAADAILDHFAHPNVFDPTRGIPLDRFLLLPATRNLNNLLQAEARRRIREREYAHQLRAANDCAAAAIERRCDIEMIRRRFIDQSDPAERAAVECWLAGARTTGELAESLNVMRLPQVEQQRAVKRFKDRVIRRLSRALRQKASS
jgi:hypothetical protein